MAETATVEEVPKTEKSKDSNGKPQPTASLYVGELQPDVTEAMIYEKFSQIGPVLSIRVCRDMITRKSLGYGYVNFQNHEDAEKALDNLNFEQINNKPIRIMWSQRDPSLRKSGKGNIFIKNLDKSITQKELYDTFQSFGPILSVKISMDERGVSKGYGFVHFEHETSAENAIQKVNGMLIKDRAVFVGKFVAKSERNMKEIDLPFNNCFIKNFGPELTEEKLSELFSSFGEILSCKIMTDEDSKSKGFGFVSFKTPESAASAVQKLNNYEISGKNIYVGKAQKKSERHAELKSKFEKQKIIYPEKNIIGINLYVKNLDDNIDDVALRKEFEKYGYITSAKVMVDVSGRSRGFGFVSFASADEATKAVSELNGKIIGSKPLYVAIAQKKDERQAQLLSQHANKMFNFNSASNIYGTGLSGNSMMRPNLQTPFFQTPQIYPSNALQMRNNRWNIPAQQQQQFANRPTPTLTAPQRPVLGQNSFPMFVTPHGTRINLGGGMPGNTPYSGSGMQSFLNSQQIPVDHQRPYSVMPSTVQNQQVNHTMVTQSHQNYGTPSTSQSDETGHLRQNNGNTSPAEQRQLIGERLYAIIHDSHPNLAGKITGMLLEHNARDLLGLLNKPELLYSKVTEAISVLEKAKQTGSDESNGVVNQNPVGSMNDNMRFALSQDS